MAAGTSIITERSPYIVRTSFTLAQVLHIIGDGRQETASEGRDPDVDYAPVTKRLNFFKGALTAVAARSSKSQGCRSPNPDFAPFLQRHEGRQARRHVRVRAARPGRQLHEAVCRARLDKSASR